MTKFRLTVIAAAFLLLIGLAGYNWYNSLHPRANVTTSQADPDARAPGGPFTLKDQTGQVVTESILKGKWTAVFFGYTYCPDVCPLTLQSLARTQTALERIGGKDADKLQIVFITVDPERDTPANMKAYLDSNGFPKGVIGLTGTREQIEMVEAAYHVTAKKTGDGDTYTYNHTAMVFLMDPKGQFNSPMMSDLAPEESAKQIRDAMKGR